MHACVRGIACMGFVAVWLRAPMLACLYAYARTLAFVCDFVAVWLPCVPCVPCVRACVICMSLCVPCVCACVRDMHEFVRACVRVPMRNVRAGSVCARTCVRAGRACIMCARACVCA